MTLKKTRAEKEAKLPRACDYTRAFKKDWRDFSRAGRADMARLKEVMMLIIANDAPLPAEWKDHSLTGEWRDFRECHVGGDFLLIYSADAESVEFTRLGTHAQLFR